MLNLAGNYSVMQGEFLLCQHKENTHTKHVHVACRELTSLFSIAPVFDNKCSIFFSFHYTSVHMSTTTHWKGVSGAVNWGTEGCLKLRISKNQHLIGEIKSFSQNEQTTNKSHKYATPIKIQLCVLKQAPHHSQKKGNTDMVQSTQKECIYIWFQ